MSFLTKDKKTLLLVDVSNIMLKAIHSYKHIVKDGMFIGGIHGFITQVAVAIRETEATHVVFCYDRKPYFRAEELGAIEYKPGRKREGQDRRREDFTLEAIEHFTRTFTEWKFDGLEADDLFAYAINRYYHRFDKIIVHTSDTDIYQCFRKDDKKLAFWRNLKKGLFTYKDFVNLTGYKLGDEWLGQDAITGGHNGMRKGLRYFGEKKARDLIQSRTTYNVSDFLYLCGEEASLNFMIMKLPHKRISEYSGQIRLGKNTLKRNDLMQFCFDYDLKLGSDWISIFTKVK